ncbi:MAG: retroviral-like aspartic protease family protein [Gammaproteobacteria bacterium]
MKTISLVLLIGLTSLSVTAFNSADTAMEDATVVPMEVTNTSAFRVSVGVKGLGNKDFLVDTGAGYMVINEASKAKLEAKGLATYVRDLEGILADGSTRTVPVFRLASINIGGSCEIRNVEAAVFPGDSRELLGLSALQPTAPFLFSMEPPRLHLSNCSQVALKP